MSDKGKTNSVYGTVTDIVGNFSAVLFCCSRGLYDRVIVMWAFGMVRTRFA